MSLFEVIAFSENEDQKKYFLKGELTVDNIKKFAEDFLEDRLQPSFKSDPIPETNNGDVKIVVGNNFDEIVLDESKDVLLEVSFRLNLWKCRLWFNSEVRLVVILPPLSFNTYDRVSRLVMMRDEEANL